MRIGVLTSLYPSPERPYEGIFAARRWEGMTARGHDVRVVAPVPWAPAILAPILSDDRARLARVPRAETRDGVPVERARYLHVPRVSAGNARRFARTGVRALLGGGADAPDVVVCDYAWPAAEAAESLAAAGVPCVVNGRGSDVLQVRDVVGLRERLAAGLRAASGWTAVSDDLLDAMRALGGAKEHVALVPNGVDADRFSPGPRGEARARLSLPSDGEIVLCVGHLIERKDPLLALASFVRHAPSSSRLVFVGRGPLEDRVATAAREAGAPDRVTLVGERPPEELVDWYRAADVLLLTSSREGRPNVVLEALSSGCPVIATEAGGTAEVLPGEENLIRERDPDAIGRRVAQVLDDPPSAADLRASVAHLTWDSGLDALERVLRAVAR